MAVHYSPDNFDYEHEDPTDIALEEALAKRVWSECKANIPGLKDRLEELIYNGNIVRPTGCSPKKHAADIIIHALADETGFKPEAIRYGLPESALHRPELVRA